MICSSVYWRKMRHKANHTIIRCRMPLRSTVGCDETYHYLRVRIRDDVAQQSSLAHASCDLPSLFLLHPPFHLDKKDVLKPWQIHLFRGMVLSRCVIRLARVLSCVERLRINDIPDSRAFVTGLFCCGRRKYRSLHKVICIDEQTRASSCRTGD